MLEDVLLKVGSIVKVQPNHENIQDYMIIGRRIVSTNSKKAWDYISIPFPEGLNLDRNDVYNFFYFNHYEIEEIVEKR